VLMRWDRFITLKLIRPLRREGFNRSMGGLPILMYHSIADDVESETAPYYRVCTRPAVFREHMTAIVNGGYRVIPLEGVIERLLQGRSLPEKSVIITFDDGFRNFYTDAFPVLQEHGFSATVFLPTAFIGRQRRSFKAKECLTWAEVCELQKCGICFGSHTVNHPNLIELSWPEIKKELSASKLELEHNLGEAMTTFAHPFAFPQAERDYVERFRALLVELGYSCCVTTTIGRVESSADPYRLPRLPVNSLDDFALFRAKLEGAYDWLALPQAITKYTKRWICRSSSSIGTRVTTSEPV
jgi:peptidoglycan/xylan/chitin deacetylase (PgdA/CDA1 family)